MDNRLNIFCVQPVYTKWYNYVQTNWKVIQTRGGLTHNIVALVYNRQLIRNLRHSLSTNLSTVKLWRCPETVKHFSPLSTPPTTTTTTIYNKKG